MKACNQLCPWNTLYGCKKPENEPCILSNIPCESFEQKPYTNADHIRAMTDEELVGFVYACDLGFLPWCDKHCERKGNDGCDKCISSWLERPYTEDE